jgi:pyoverdine/dityrosine biosynthesis protein Dit1
MTPQQYIIQRLKSLDFPNDSRGKFESPGELSDFIYKAVMNKKFRKYSVGSEYQKHIYSAIELNVKNNEPIKLALPFGSYKLWRLEESPEADWAELFTLMYYTDWLKVIAHHYKPGVRFDFCADDIVLAMMNNLPEEDIVTYKKTFRELLKFIKSHLPVNLIFTLSPISERYDSHQTFLDELKEKMGELQRRGITKTPLTDERKATMDLNVKLTAEQTADPHWYDRVRLIHDSYMEASKRRSYYRTPDKLLVATNKFSETNIAVGTTKTSIAKFWTGVGVLKKTANGYIEVVLSPSQLNSTKFEWHEISISGLNGRNFSQLRII